MVFCSLLRRRQFIFSPSQNWQFCLAYFFLLHFLTYKVSYQLINLEISQQFSLILFILAFEYFRKRSPVNSANITVLVFFVIHESGLVRCRYNDGSLLHWYIFMKRKRGKVDKMWNKRINILWGYENRLWISRVFRDTSQYNPLS